ncbi:hypothetical protein KSP35_05810 [Aquihabitans sp. G128]|uniref:hypothetical protein n=1 Tax=Aquihabitans sp. G128 TaxID=2849779 RepID=UPI001C244D64|nr:hypothetical protein [Aquihabitans sp. G128]QXC62320.1 hypothetical protein KSP35_05810 [Aquihabitans sp. G128]
MEWLLVALIAILCTATTLACIVALIARNRVNRHHRVDPAVPTDAPLTWLVDPRAPAKLHRRLAKVGTSTTAVADDLRPTGRKARKVEPSPLVATAEDLRAQAVLLDRQVARLAVLAAGARRGPLHQLGRSVDDVEAAAARLVALSTQVRTPRGLSADDGTLADITARVDRLAEAHQELVELDRGNGLHDRPLAAPPLVRTPEGGARSPLPPPPAPRPATRPTAAAPPSPGPADDTRVAPQTEPPQPQTWPPTPSR